RTSPGERSVSVSGSGTPSYMAPEVWRGKASAYSDQYSLAVSYAELRVHRAIFMGSDWMQVMWAHINQTPDLAARGAAELEVGRKALAKDAAQRSPSCLQFVRELEKAVARDQGLTLERSARFTATGSRDSRRTLVARGPTASQSIPFTPPPP